MLVEQINEEGDFPAFGRGLSLRQQEPTHLTTHTAFPRLRAGTFIEADKASHRCIPQW